MSGNLTGEWEKLGRQQTEILRLLTTAKGTPKAGEWTAAQHVEHLALADEEAARQAETPSDKQGGMSKLILPLVCLLLRFGPSVPVPPSLADIEPRAEITPDAAAAHWAEARASFQARIQSLTPEDAGRIVFRHPVGGPLDARQTLQLGLAHGEYHRRKISRLTP